MKLGSVFAQGHSGNSPFAAEDSTHKFNPTHTMRQLREAFAQRGIEINTADVNGARPIDFELHVEGRELPPGPSAVPRFLVALENPYINPLNADAGYFDHFQRIFTWDPRFFGRPDATRIAYGVQFTGQTDWPGFEQRDIFSCLINANKRFGVELETDLYVERVEVIRWHEQHAPQDFALFGLGWDKPRHESSRAGKLRRRMQRLATQLFGYRPFPSWQGAVPDKSSVLLRSKFSYCYENVRDLTGYVTEKIFDSLLSGCVPVYWGADDIAQQVPEECYIDRRRFRDTAEVHAALRRMSADEYAQRQQAIRRFVEGPASLPFRSTTFANTVAEGVATDLAARQR
jgi:hypothetical protein